MIGQHLGILQREQSYKAEACLMSVSMSPMPGIVQGEQQEERPSTYCH